MSLLQKVLSNAPPEWEKDEYKNVRYVLKKVDKNTEEYEEIKHFIKSKVDNRNLFKIMRVQHPYAYGRYLLKKRQAEKYSTILNESRELTYVKDESHVAKLLEFNCDHRRPGVKGYYSSDIDCVIIVNKLRTTCQDSDSDLYPQYFVQLKPAEYSSEDDSVSSLSLMMAKYRI